MAAIMVTRVMEGETGQKYEEWKRIQRLGRNKVTKASTDPVAKAILEDEISRPISSLGEPSLQASEDQYEYPPDDPGPATLPAFLSMSSVSNALSNALTELIAATEPSRRRRGPSFLALPTEVRNMIYRCAVDYPTCRGMFDSYYRYNKPEAVRSRYQVFVPHHTPTVLLLCKQITREALAVLRARPFVIDRIPPWIFGEPSPLPITYFITPRTLCTIRFFEVKITLGEGSHSSGSVWRQILDDVFTVWRDGHSVARVRVMFKLCNLEFEDLWRSWELIEYEQLVKFFDLIGYACSTRPGAVLYEHWILDGLYAYRSGFRNPLIRKHPDGDIWQGSVLEYV